MAERDEVVSPDEGAPVGSPRPLSVRLRTFAVARAHAFRVRVGSARRRFGALDATLQAIERDAEIGGRLLAGALAYRLFVFVLPLAFFLVSSLGLVARAFGKEPGAIVTALGLSGFVSEQVAAAADGDWSLWIALTSFLVVVFVTRSLLRAVVIVHALAWQRTAAQAKVTRRSLGVFAVAIAGQVALVLCTAAVREHASAGVLVLLAAVCAFAGLWLWVSLELPHSTARWVDLVPGAVLYGLGILAVQVFNFYILDSLLQSKSSAYGALGAAAAILLGLFLTGRAIVVAAVLNATLFARRRGGA